MVSNFDSYVTGFILFVVGFQFGVMRFCVNSRLVFGSVNSRLVLLLLFLDFDLGSWDFWIQVWCSCCPAFFFRKKRWRGI